MNKRIAQTLVIVATFVAMSGCTFYSTAKHWNDRKDIDGFPVYYKAATKVGFKLLVIVPFLGDLSIDGLIADLTEEIANEEGDRIRLVQGSAESYWYGWPPFTWVLTPVVCEVSAEYRPSWDQMAKDRIEDMKRGRVRPR